MVAVGSVLSHALRRRLRSCLAGITYQHRFNRGGERQANSAIRIVTIWSLRTDEHTEEYVAKKTSEGNTRMRPPDV